MPLNYIKNSYNNLKRDYWDNALGSADFYKELGKGSTWFHHKTDDNIGNAALNAAFAIPVNTVATIGNVGNDIANTALMPFTDYRIERLPYWTGYDFFDGDKGVSEAATDLADLYAAGKFAKKPAAAPQQPSVAVPNVTATSKIVNNAKNTANAVKNNRILRDIAAFNVVTNPTAQRAEQGQVQQSADNMKRTHKRTPYNWTGVGIGGTIGTLLGAYFGSRNRLLWSLLGGAAGAGVGAYVQSRYKA